MRGDGTKELWEGHYVDAYLPSEPEVLLTEFKISSKKREVVQMYLWMMPC